MDKSQKTRKKVNLKRRYLSDAVVVEEKPPPKPPKVPDSGVNEEVLAGLSEAFSLLYDPNFYGHLPPDEQLKKFKKRDLLETKLYKTALKAFGSQQFVRERLAKDNGRKRVFIAQPLAEMRGFDSFSAPQLPSIRQEKSFSRTAEPAPGSATASNSSDDSMQYRSWLQRRQKQHNDLQQMGNVERYLRNKGQLSSAERRAMKNICESRRPPPEEVVVEDETKERSRVSTNVEVKRPSPLALFIIDLELKKRKLRLSDLFSSMDRDKNWLLSRDEFRTAMKQNRVPLPEPLLEDMIITLDEDNNNQLDYRELSRGLDQFRRERRSPEFLSLLSQQSNEFLLSRSSDDQQTDEQQQQQQQQEQEERNEEDDVENGEKSEVRGQAGSPAAASASSDSLSPGQFDVSQERYSVANREQSVDLRKRDQIALRQLRAGGVQRHDSGKTMIKTFDSAIDDHMSLSVLPERELADMVDEFRQQQLREYMAVVEACKQRGVVFSERMYKHVLLYPADRPHRQIRRHVRPPGQKSELPLEALYQPGKSGRAGAVGGGFGASFGAAGTGGQAASHLAGDSRRHLGGVRCVNLARAKDNLPSKDDLLVDEEDAEQELVTGTAIIRPKVDCWLTFEEFQRMSANVDYSRQTELRRPNRGAFWPGRLEHRVRLFLDGNDTIHGAGVFFQKTAPSRPTKAHPYHARETWPVNNGHVTYGSIDPQLKHEITQPRNAAATSTVS